jgi:hypothetical protein
MKNRPSDFEAKPLTNRLTLVLRLNEETRAPHLHMHSEIAHGATRPLDHPATEYPTCATISGHLHQVAYYCHDPHRCTSCHTCQLHTMRQANTILQMKQR